jgi:hypothetical protein
MGKGVGETGDLLLMGYLLIERTCITTSCLVFPRTLPTHLVSVRASTLEHLVGHPLHHYHIPPRSPPSPLQCLGIAEAEQGRMTAGALRSKTDWGFLT